MGASGLAVCLAGAGALIAIYARHDILGLAPDHAVALLACFAGATYATGWASAQARGGLRATCGAIAVWLLLIGVCGLVYLDRDAVLTAARTASDRVGIGEPVAEIGAGGEVSVRRRLDGTFVVPVTIAGRDVPFIFDTGASTVVLTAPTARLIGYSAEALRYTIPVTTANGRAYAAHIVLDRVEIGPIDIRHVAALVVAPGMLEGNLLGMSLLERLTSYEVRGSRLVLRARKG